MPQVQAITPVCPLFFFCFGPLKQKIAYFSSCQYNEITLFLVSAMETNTTNLATQRQSGRWITTLEGYRAFHPDPLPPTIQWSPQLASALADASLLVGKLAGEGRRLPHLLIRPFVRREAVLSSRIEGTQTTLGELLAAEAGAVVERSPDDLREVGNYVTALEYGIDRLKTLPLSLRLVRELHERLMAGVRGGHATPGEFRRSQNWIGKAGDTLNQASYEVCDATVT
jgi:hypothetical protein